MSPDEQLVVKEYCVRIIAVLEQSVSRVLFLTPDPDVQTYFSCSIHILQHLLLDSVRYVYPNKYWKVPWVFLPCLFISFI